MQKMELDEDEIRTVRRALSHYAVELNRSVQEDRFDYKAAEQYTQCGKLLRRISEIFPNEKTFMG